MKEKIIEILNKYIVTEGNTCYCNSEVNDLAIEITKMVEFEELCNHPEVGEANMNEAVIMQNYVTKEEYDDAVNYIGQLQEQIKDMEEELRRCNYERSNY